MNITEKIEKIGLVPVIKVNNISHAKPLADALVRGGLPCAEVTFRTDIAADVIKEMKKARPEMIVGAGTVISNEQVDKAISSGAEFIVSPGFSPDLVKYCKGKSIPVFPGCSNASEVQEAVNLGLDVVKFFPAEISGGIKAIKALAAPYYNMKFFPTGGINSDNISGYMSYEKIFACGGTWMVPEDLLEKEDFNQIEEITRQAVYSMLGFRLAHVGINCEDATEASEAAKKFDQMFGFKASENPGSIFSDSYVESLKSPYLGKKGHIAIATYSVERAIDFLNRIGVEINEDSIGYRENGLINTAYLKDEVSGFAIHLVRKNN